MCVSPTHHIFMYRRRDKNINFYIVHIAQTKRSIKSMAELVGCSSPPTPMEPPKDTTHPPPQKK